MLQKAYSIRCVKVKPPSRAMLLAARAALHTFKEELEADPIRDIQSIRMCRDSLCILNRILLRDIETNELEWTSHAVMG